MGQPMTQPFLTIVAVLIHENAPGWQMGKHFASHPRGHVELVHFGGIEILPVGNEAYPIRKDPRLHCLNLASNDGFALCRYALYCVDVVVDGLGLCCGCSRQEKREQPDRQFHAPPPRWTR